MTRRRPNGRIDLGRLDWRERHHEAKEHGHRDHQSTVPDRIRRIEAVRRVLAPVLQARTAAL